MVNNKKWFRPMFERTAQRTATMIALLERSRYGECLYCKNPDQIRMKISGIGQKPFLILLVRIKVQHFHDFYGNWQQSKV